MWITIDCIQRTLTKHIELMKNQIPHSFKQLIGKTIAKIEYLSNEECNELMWFSRPVVIVFTDGTYMVPVVDEEGNDGGALWYEHNGASTVIYTEAVETIPEMVGTMNQLNSLTIQEG